LTSTRACGTQSVALRETIVNVAIGCAKYWKAQGKSLREIAMKLMEDGHRPKRGGQWFAQQVKQLLIA
jgi:hypothetical protein